MAHECFIEVNRKGGGVARVRADAITAVIEVITPEPDRGKPTIQLHLGANNFIIVQDEPLWSIWNKMIQALGGRQIPCITLASPDIPGHPEFGKKKVAA